MKFNRRGRSYRKKKFVRRFKKRRFSKKRKLTGLRADMERFTVFGSLIFQQPNSAFNLNVTTEVYNLNVAYSPTNVMTLVATNDPRVNGMLPEFEEVALGKYSITRRVFANAGTSVNSNFWGAMAIDPTYNAGALSEAVIMQYKNKVLMRNGSITTKSLDIKRFCKQIVMPWYQNIVLNSPTNSWYASTNANYIGALPAILTTSNFQNSASIASDVIYEDVLSYRVIFRKLRRIS